MPFLTHNNIASELPTGYNQTLVARLLVRLSIEFKKLGLVFDLPIETIQSVKGQNGNYNSLFDFTLAKDITAVNLKYLGSDSNSLLVRDVDYNLVEHSNLDGYYYRIEMLRRQLNPNEYLGLTAKYGVFIDFKSGAPTDESAILLQGVVVDWILKQLDYASRSYQHISSSSTGDTSVSFKELDGRKYYSCILSDPEFRSALDYFQVFSL